MSCTGQMSQLITALSLLSMQDPFLISFIQPLISTPIISPYWDYTSQSELKWARETDSSVVKRPEFGSQNPNQETTGNANSRESITIFWLLWALIPTWYILMAMAYSHSLSGTNTHMVFSLSHSVSLSLIHTWHTLSLTHTQVFKNAHLYKMSLF